MAPHLHSNTLVASATKGLEQTTLLRMSEVICQVANDRKIQCRVGAISGPTFAAEVARGDPTAITVASKDSELAKVIQRAFSDPTFRVYTNDDVVGVELGGSLKKIIAIAAGVCHGLNLGHNSVAALITRGLAEITPLVVAWGGPPENLTGPPGFRHLRLTRTCPFSPNPSG